MANRLCDALGADGIKAEAIHGNKSQGARQRALENFRSGRTRVLVATDIAARGIDVKGISLVIQHDLPEEPESYVHRIGRTARAGKDGKAIALLRSRRAQSPARHRAHHPPDHPRHHRAALRVERRPGPRALEGRQCAGQSPALPFRRSWWAGLSSLRPAQRRRPLRQSSGSARRGPFALRPRRPGPILRSVAAVHDRRTSVALDLINRR